MVVTEPIRMDKMRKKKPSDFLGCRISEPAFLSSRGSFLSDKVRTPLFISKELTNHTIVFHLYRGHKFANISIRNKSGEEVGVVTYSMLETKWKPSFNFGLGNPFKRTKKEFVKKMKGLDKDLSRWINKNI